MQTMNSDPATRLTRRMIPSLLKQTSAVLAQGAASVFLLTLGLITIGCPRMAGAIDPPPAQTATTATAAQPVLPGLDGQILTIDFDKDQGSLFLMRAAVAEASPEQHPALETRILKILQHPAATYEARQFCCRMLARVGTVRSVPALADLLKDEQLGHMARIALETIPGPEIDALLRGQLSIADGDRRLGLIDVLARRRDTDAVAMIADLAGSSDPQLVAAALNALGRIGGVPGVNALDAAEVAGEFALQKDHAYILAADGLAADGHAASALAIYRRLVDLGRPVSTRIAALNGIVRTERQDSVPTLMVLMRGEELGLAQAAAQAAALIPDSNATRLLASNLDQLVPRVRPILIQALATRGDPQALPAVLDEIDNDDQTIRLAAIDAAGRLGDLSAVSPLLDRLDERGPVAVAAVEALSRLRGDGIDDRLVAGLDTLTTPTALRDLIDVLERRDVRAIDRFIVLTDHADNDVARRSWNAIGALAPLDRLVPLANRLVKVERSAIRPAAERAIARVAERNPDKDARPDPILAALETLDPAGQAALLGVLGNMGGEKTLAAIKSRIEAPDGTLRDAAARALAAWRDDAAAPALLDLAESSENDRHRALAVRGFLRIAVDGHFKRGDEPTLDMLRDARPLLSRTEDKHQWLSGIARIDEIEALQLAAPFIGDFAVDNEARAAVLHLADRLDQRHPQEVANVLRVLIAASDDDAFNEQADAIVKGLQRP
jgi:HEAT repeat protein